MTCQEFQEHITAAVDRLLPVELQQEFAEHAGRCRSCRDEYELEGVTKSMVQLRLGMVTTPGPLAGAIRDRLLREAVAGRDAAETWWARLWHASTIKPVIAFVVACGAVVLLLNQTEQHGESQRLAAVENNVIVQSLTNYRAVVSGTIKPQVVSSEPESVRHFFEGKTEFPVFIPAMKECTLLGGVVNDFSGTRLAHVFYRHNKGIVYVYQACWSTVMKGEKLKLPEEAKEELRRTGWFTETHPDGNTVVLWTKGNTLCAAVAHMPIESLIACVTSESLTAGDHW